MNRLSEAKAKAIAIEYASNGFDKVKTLLAMGYKPSYAASRGLKLYDNAIVKQEVERIRAKFVVITDITAQKVLTDIETARTMALTKGDMGSAIRASELQGKYIGMFEDRVPAVNIQLNTLLSPGDEHKQLQARLNILDNKALAGNGVI